MNEFKRSLIAHYDHFLFGISSKPIQASLFFRRVNYLGKYEKRMRGKAKVIYLFFDFFFCVSVRFADLPKLYPFFLLNMTIVIHVYRLEKFRCIDFGKI
jgi:hypothetical protein